MRFLAVIATVLITMALAACGGSDDSQSRTSTATVGTAGSSASTTAAAKTPLATTTPVTRHRRSTRLKTNMSKAEIAELPKIVIAKRTGPPPRHMVVRDLRKGTGPVLVKGDRVHARYFDAEYPEVQNRSRSGLYGPIDFAFEELLKGWKAGLPGMRVGGRRELVFPPKLIYPRWKPSWGYKPYVRIYVIDLTGIALK